MDVISNLDYVDKCRLTESRLNEEQIKERFTPENVRLLHSVLGMVTESGELADQVKKHLFYGKPLDVTNLIEELGDLLWYVSIQLSIVRPNDLDPYRTVQNVNIAKLSERYNKKFNDRQAINRDTEKEVSVMEQSLKEQE